MFILPELLYLFEKYNAAPWPVGELTQASHATNSGENHNTLWYVNRNYIVYVKCGKNKQCRLSPAILRKIHASEILEDPDAIVKMYEEYNSSYKVAFELGISASAVRDIYKRRKEELRASTLNQQTPNK